MRILVTGDTHGTFDIGKVMRFFEGREDEFTKDDLMTITVEDVYHARGMDYDAPLPVAEEGAE